MLRPSDAHLWVPCSLAGHVLASGEYHATPQPPEAMVESDARREGICAGWAAELLITGAVDQPRELVGMRHGNGWIIDEEMAHHAAGFVAYCRSFGPVTRAEVPVELFGGLIRGRLDATTEYGTVYTARVFDLKYGWRPVEAHHNWSMLCYGLAVTEDTDRDLEMHIYQPRPHHPDGQRRVWRIEAAELPRWREWLWAVASEARDNPRASVGPHCDRCPALTSCHANARTSYGLYAAQQERRMVSHTAMELAAELRFLERAETIIADRRKALEAEASARIVKGELIPGYAREPRKGNRAFTAPLETVALITGREVYKPKPKSPAELEREGVPEHVMNRIAARPTIGWKLTGNPEIFAEKMFGKAKGTE